jgi:hypothetical protein
MGHSYNPESYYGLIPGSYRERSGPRFGLVPWPEHLQPRKASAPEKAKQPAPEVSASLANASGVFFVTLSADDRAGIATTIERLINMLDDMEGDENLEATGDEEPSLGWPSNGSSALNKDAPTDDREGEAHWTDAGPMYELEQDDSDNEPTLGAPEGTVHNQQQWEASSAMPDECEEENEHGGDVNDEPHDGDGDAEPNLGRLETIHQGGGTYSGISDDETGLLAGNLAFEGEGYSIGNQMLDAAGADRARVSPGLPRGKWAEIARKLPDGTVVRTCKAPDGSRVPELRTDDFGRLSWA